jgi:hypothetical protein
MMVSTSALRDRERLFVVLTFVLQGHSGWFHVLVPLHPDPAGLDTPALMPKKRVSWAMAMHAIRFRRRDEYRTFPPRILRIKISDEISPTFLRMSREVSWEVSRGQGMVTRCLKHMQYSCPDRTGSVWIVGHSLPVGNHRSMTSLFVLMDADVRRQ